MMMLLRLYALWLLVAWPTMVQGVCDFEQYLNSTEQTSNTANVQWQVNLNTPAASSSCNVANPHKRQGVLKITTPSSATKTIIRLHQKGETCFASWHLAMDWTNGKGGGNAELHTVGVHLYAYGRYPGPGPDKHAPGIDTSYFVSTTTATKMDVSIFDRTLNTITEHHNVVDKVYPPCEPERVHYINQNMFRIEDMKTNGVYLGLNRVVSGQSDRVGSGLYYVCVEFEYTQTG